ncbi:pyridoxal phosphate-dependent aminotransferase [Pseudarthrobacter sp. SSS035]|uniref:pyridoxal phosphate-dependent aminotransferase n=1 Tax=Pseudarthrobacter sp. SSS035 TaxID=2931399 RepID=UPI0021132CE1|nr:aminotransferase class I/II-fold pyridoxal phosphate-dependent enzyme [Pseudarthrobacter sp. SSS035]
MKKYDAYVLVDELYSRLVFGDEFCHLAAQPDMRDHCITTLGTSKTESMSGFRVGCVVAPETLIAALPEVLEVTALRASSYAQYSLLDWLGPDESFIAERVTKLRELRDLTVSRLECVPGIDITSPGGTAYVFPRLRKPLGDDFEVAEVLVRDAGVLVYPGLSFGPSGSGGFRLCFAQADSVMPGILDRVATTLTRLSIKRGTHA